MADVNVVLGSGTLGAAVVRKLQADGKPIRVVSRSGKNSFAGVEVMRGDLNDPEFVTSSCEGAASVFHCAMPAYEKWTTEFLPLNTSIIEGVARSGAALVWGDNMYAYGRVTGVRDEDTPMNATTRKGHVRRLLAEQLLEANESGRVGATIVRASDFYGPGVRISAAGDFMFKRMLQGKSAQWLGDPDAPHSFTHINDFAAAMVTVAGSREAQGKVWHAPTLSGVSAREFVSEIARQIGTESRISVPPKLILRVMGIFNRALKETFEMEYERTEPFLVESSRIEKSLGLTPMILQDGVANTLNALTTQNVNGTRSDAIS